jgi:hypothetical protein
MASMYINLFQGQTDRGLFNWLNHAEETWLSKQEVDTRVFNFWGKSAATFCHQVAAWDPDMFCNFYLVKNHNC